MNTFQSSRERGATTMERISMILKTRTILRFFAILIPMMYFVSLRMSSLSTSSFSAPKESNPKSNLPIISQYHHSNLTTTINTPVNTTPNSNHPLQNKVTLTTHQTLTPLTTLTHRRPRQDRMGSRIQLPLTIWAYAHLKNVHFCTPYELMAASLSFPICPPGFIEGEGRFENDNLTRGEFDEFLELIELVGLDELEESTSNSTTTNSTRAPGGIYFVNEKNNPLLKLMMDHEYGTDERIFRGSDISPTTFWTDATIQQWNAMILHSKHSSPPSPPSPRIPNHSNHPNHPNHPNHLKHPMHPNHPNQWLWHDPHAIHIAVHVRRGDITPDKRNDVFVADDVVIAQIEMVKRYIHMIYGKGVTTEVHIFSEAYGTTDWSKYENYENLVQEFHLAPRGSKDIGLNLRDWKHFVKAEVMIVGGTFSRIPSYGRLDVADQEYKVVLDDEKDGLPIAPFAPITLCHHPTKYSGCRKNWVHWKYGRSREEIIVNFPSVTMIARSPQLAEQIAEQIVEQKEAEDPLSGLCEECLLASVPKAFRCTQRVELSLNGLNRKGSDADLYEALLGVSEQYPACDACHPDTCRYAPLVFHETFTLDNGWKVKLAYRS